MSIAEEVRRNFEDLGPPCAPEDPDRAECELGHPLPAILRELYQAFDGLRATDYASARGGSISIT